MFSLTPTDRQRLILFTRYPQPGTTKTRLIPALGAEGAADLQRQMTEYVLTQVTDLLTDRPLSVEIWFASATPEANLTDRQRMEAWLGKQWSYQAQGTGDLGARMARAFQTAFDQGVQQVVTIGTDCPSVDADRLQQAFQLLEKNDLVLGPATDGGYYLIGLRRFVADLFSNMPWGSSAVFEQTMRIAHQLNLSVGLLDPLTDIDRPVDLPVWYALAAQRSASSAAPTAVQATARPALSIIIPTLNEAATITALLQSIQQSLGQAHEPSAVEILVVDGGSRDDTVARARAQGAVTLEAATGRASQMNAGARAATGEILLFLHADTYLPDRFLPLIQQTLAQPQTIAGAFELQIDGKSIGLRLVEWGVNWRSRRLQFPYGDQALFLKASTFHQIGGFADLPIMEDFELVGRLRTQGRVAIVPEGVTTSARRWQHLGILKTTLINQWIIVAYWLGVPPQRLASWYRDTKGLQQGKHH